MTTAEVARALRARRIGRGKYMTHCPAHRERTGSLSITDMGAGNTRLHCFGGCAQADVLRAAGLAWKDLRPGAKIDAKELAATKRKLELEEFRASQLRIGDWIVRFIEQGYTREDRDNDMGVIAACAIVLSNRPSGTWERIFRTHMERIAAANHCVERRMLPEVAKARFWEDEMSTGCICRWPKVEVTR